LRRVQDLDGEQVARLVVVEDHARLALVALGNRPSAKDHREGVRLAVVLDLHRALQYFANLLAR
jgi:hypothetical protein